MMKVSPEQEEDSFNPRYGVPTQEIYVGEIYGGCAVEDMNGHRAARNRRLRASALALRWLVRFRTSRRKAALRFSPFVFRARPAGSFIAPTLSSEKLLSLQTS